MAAAVANASPECPSQRSMVLMKDSDIETALKDKKILAFRTLSKIPLILDPLKRVLPVAKVLLPVALGILVFWAGMLVERSKYFG